MTYTLNAETKSITNTWSGREVPVIRYFPAQTSLDDQLRQLWVLANAAKLYDAIDHLTNKKVWAWQKGGN